MKLREPAHGRGLLEASSPVAVEESSAPEAEALEARGYLEPFTGSSGFDIVADFGAKLPVMVIGSMLGVPVEDQDDIRILTDQLLHRDEGEIDSSTRMARVNFYAYSTMKYGVNVETGDTDGDRVCDDQDACLSGSSGAGRSWYRRRLEH